MQAKTQVKLDFIGWSVGDGTTPASTYEGRSVAMSGRRSSLQALAHLSTSQNFRRLDTAVCVPSLKVG